MKILPPIRRLLAKTRLPVLIGGIILFFLSLIVYACSIPLPSQERPLLFYSNQTRQDIRLTFYKALKAAQTSIFLSVYGISDPLIIELLKEKYSAGIDLRVEYDPSASLPLKQQLSIAAMPIKTKGLMHRKIVVIDHTITFLGSANFTPTSLSHHDNLIIGFYHKELAQYLEHPFSNHFSFELGHLHGSLFLLPDPSQHSFHSLLSTLESAQKKIHIAMFTLTHPQIVEALIQAKQRGVEVSIAIDYYTARGASRKSLEKLQAQGIPCYCSQGRELLHYKWALIDDTTFIMGSANWTSAAFEKNQDFLLFLTRLGPKEQHFIQDLWNIITTEATLTCL